MVPLSKNLKIATQRWVAYYTEGYEAWAVVRDTGYPVVYKNANGTGYNTTNTVSDSDVFELGNLNGAYPQRMRYGSGAYNKNEANTLAANAAQGADVKRLSYGGLNNIEHCINLKKGRFYLPFFLLLFMKIRPAKNNDLARVVEIANACADHMISKGDFSVG